MEDMICDIFSILLAVYFMNFYDSLFFMIRVSGLCISVNDTEEIFKCRNCNKSMDSIMQVIPLSKLAPGVSACLTEGEYGKSVYVHNFSEVMDNQTIPLFNILSSPVKELYPEVLQTCVKRWDRICCFDSARDNFHESTFHTKYGEEEEIDLTWLRDLHQFETASSDDSRRKFGSILQRALLLILNKHEIKRRTTWSTRRTKANIAEEFARTKKKRQDSPMRESLLKSLQGKADYSEASANLPELLTYRIYHVQGEIIYEEDGMPTVSTNSKIEMYLYGINFEDETTFSISTVKKNKNDDCERLEGRMYQANKMGKYKAEMRIDLTGLHIREYFFCIRHGEHWFHQGPDIYFKTHHQEQMALWALLLIVSLLLVQSGTLSGLNLGLMSLNETELTLISRTGTPLEQKFSLSILPVRKRGNFLLCTILLGNTLVNAAISILMNDLAPGAAAVAISTLVIVIMGEIVPQAICSRHGLFVGAKSLFIIKTLMYLTSPLSFPISKILDAILGEEMGASYNREKLKELIMVSKSDLEREEMDIIAGTLTLKDKTVLDIMTKLEDSFLLNYDAVLDFETVSAVMKSGYSRVPVYRGERTNIVSLLYIKDLAFVDPDDNTPLKTLCKYYKNPINFVSEEKTLDVMFKEFKEGRKGHMAFVQRTITEDNQEKLLTIGLVTLEDVIEELIQAEIVDETDVWEDNHARRRIHPLKSVFSEIAEKKSNQMIGISPQMSLATFQYLSTTVHPFKPDQMQEAFLTRLMKQDVFRQVKIKNEKTAGSEIYIYQEGKPADYFVIILEGRAEVTIGADKMKFVCGPFTYFGVQALTSDPPPLKGAKAPRASIAHAYVPDYTVKAIKDLVYMKISRTLYISAKTASLLDENTK